MSTAPAQTGAEAPARAPTRGPGHAAAGLFSVAILWVIAFAALDEATLRFGAVLAAVVIVTQTQPATFARAPWLGRVFDAALLACFAFAGWWFARVTDQLWTGFFVATPATLAAGIGGIAVLLILAGRAWGRSLVVMALAFAAFAFAGPYLPRPLSHFGTDAGEFVQVVWYSFDGVFGRMTGLVAENLLVFLILGALFEKTGAGDSLIRISTALLGRVRGGAAHAAIAASAVFGMMSGSVAANIAGTGVFTIPMIRRQGFSRNFAGAVEAAASSGGQLTPPIMAATVFVMADLLEMPLILVIAAAALPALFKYIGLFAQVYVEAIRQDIAPLPPEDIPTLTARDWIDSALVIGPLVALMGAFLTGRSPAMAGLAGVVVALAMGLILTPRFRRDPRLIWQALCAGGISSARILLSVAVIGIVLAVINETGIAIRFGIAVAGFGESHLFYALVMAMLGALVLGMGLPTLPAYLIIAIVIAPAIVEAGVAPLAAHMFVLYFAVFSSIMPPVAYGCYIAAPIAGADPLRMSLTALRLSAVGLLVPFVFVTAPSLLLVAGGFSWAELGATMLRLLAAIWMLATALGGADPRAGRLVPAARAVRLALAAGALMPMAAIWCPTVLGAAIAGLGHPRPRPPVLRGSGQAT
ncbi:TRAP transporter permease [Palleronia sediminis]|uniref:TRAP transporter permease n=1 Tax=Palleronia sediminis TaxID=2547833 RepID=UPI00145522C8|nr:TRAP transporter fused permease subunit [Palleronia sediminis]